MTEVEDTAARQARAATRSVRLPTPTNPDHLAVRLVGNLLTKTAEGKLQWRAVGDDNDSGGPRNPRYEVDLPSGNIDIGSVDGDGRSPFDLKLFTSGPPYSLIDIFSGRDDRSLNEGLTILYKAARRSANGTDRFIRSLIQDLDRAGEELPF